MKILFATNSPTTPTGYGAQAALMLPRLLGLGHHVGMFAWYGAEGAVIEHRLTHQGTEYAYPVYPRWRDGYGNDIVQAHARHFGADLVLSLIDAWVLNPEAHGGARNWAPYFPVDSEPIPPPVLAKVKDAAFPIVYSRFGERMMRNANLTPYYVPHMVDTALFSPGDRSAARTALKWPNDAFVAVMVAANKGNPSRKNFVEQLTAFAQLTQRHDDALLYLHTYDDGADSGGVNLREFIVSLGIEGKVQFADQYAIRMGYPPSYLVNVYRAADVLLSVSAGEGFGVPIVEAQACGCPVIVGDWTAMSELCGAGWAVPKDEAHPVWTPLAAYQFVPSVAAVARALEYAYLVSHGPKWARMSTTAREFAMQYDADTVAVECWRPTLAAIAARLEVAEEVQP
jgi:glycosyltransferase involved in cell wall biosynthesis